MHGSILARRVCRRHGRSDQKTEELVVEAERGRERADALARLGGVQIAVAALVAVVLAIAFTVYLLA